MIIRLYYFTEDSPIFFYKPQKPFVQNNHKNYGNSFKYCKKTFLFNYPTTFQWADVSNAFLVEAIWYKRGHKPNMDEYMQNAWKSIAVPTILVHFYCVFSDQLSIQVLETLFEHLQNIVRCSAFVVRLANDLATSPVYQFLPSFLILDGQKKRWTVTNCKCHLTDYLHYSRQHFTSDHHKTFFFCNWPP